MLAFGVRPTLFFFLSFAFFSFFFFLVAGCSEFRSGSSLVDGAAGERGAGVDFWEGHVRKGAIGHWKTSSYFRAHQTSGVLSPLLGDNQMGVDGTRGWTATRRQCLKEPVFPQAKLLWVKPPCLMLLTHFNQT